MKKKMLKKLKFLKSFIKNVILLTIYTFKNIFGVSAIIVPIKNFVALIFVKLGSIFFKANGIPGINLKIINFINIF